MVCRCKGLERTTEVVGRPCKVSWSTKSIKQGEERVYTSASRLVAWWRWGSSEVQRQQYYLSEWTVQHSQAPCSRGWAWTMASLLDQVSSTFTLASLWHHLAQWTGQILRARIE